MNGQETIVREGKITMSKMCTITNEEYSVVIDKSNYMVWQNGALIQEVFPDLSADQREFMISGYTPAEYRDIFKDKEE